MEHPSSSPTAFRKRTRRQSTPTLGDIMKVMIEYDIKQFPPVLRMSIFGCPHYRQDKRTFMAFRKEINRAADEAGILYPIDIVVDLWVAFIDPTSPDLANSLMALYRAMDAKALTGISLLTDDGLISKVTMMKFYPSTRTRAENRVP
jgi:hypothetical protein